MLYIGAIKLKNLYVVVCRQISTFETSSPENR